MTTQPANGQDAISVLEWYRAAGVDMAVGEMPVNRLAAPPSPGMPAPAASAASAASPSQPPPSPDAAAMPLEADPEEARALARSAGSLEALQALLDDYGGCGLKLRATQLVFADGNPEADIMLIGEAPGAEEDLQGKPFVGRSGQLLDRMLGAIGLDRTKVYIANTVPWRPPGNRTPTPAEIAVCLPFLHRQIELVAPRFILTLGAPAAQTMFETRTGIMKLRGHWQSLQIGALTIAALPTLHPAYLLRQPAQKAYAWRDMLALKAALERGTPGGD